MRVLLLGLAFLLAGCAELPEFEPEPQDPRVESFDRVMPIRVHGLAEPPSGMLMEDGLIIADAVDSFHGEYRLTIDDEGIWCEVEAGPDDGAIGIVNVCSFQSETGEVFASQSAEEHNFRLLMLSELPAQPFVWDLRVDLVYADGNSTHQVTHDHVQRLLDLQPQLKTSLQLDLRGACDRIDAIEDLEGPVPHRLVRASAVPHNGHAFIVLDLDQATIWDVETNGDALVEDGRLRIVGEMGEALDATIWVDPEAEPMSAGTGGPCGTAIGYRADAFLLIQGVQGVQEAWVQEEITSAALPVWVTL